MPVFQRASYARIASSSIAHLIPAQATSEREAEYELCPAITAGAKAEFKLNMGQVVQGLCQSIKTV